ncbi:exopolyphosphatase [Spartinivicinus poritis]|uniref:Exopolyphosphatase n=1 Tax=Spartinivicinus poritis TaxID=2994640 RepID=A0ABT5U604_9GAMM|nr:exopolyphosphatase [Spartinivicinus sp. A2-2]MDE1461416.1 exopolyphosphatase [Spartinivicinus sp. A2-2]
MTARISRSNHSDQCLIAAIDLGSNSFHMIVARLDQGEIRPLERLGEKVQLAAGLDDDDYLSEEAQQRGLDCLRRFAQYTKHLEVGKVRVVGTNALRTAHNRDEFIKRAQEILSHPIDVISGREEARLIYLGVSHTQADDLGRRLVVDIGGGSTEFIIGQRFEPQLLESLHMGCVVYSQRFFQGGTITSRQFQEAYYAARLELLNIAAPYKEAGWEDVIGSSGTVKSIQNVLLAKGLTSTGITAEGMEELRKYIVSVGHIDKMMLEGLKPERVSIFPAGLAILMAVFDAFKVDRMCYSEGALREGLLYDMVGRLRHEDVRERTITALMKRYHVDRQHARRVARHALMCFDYVADQWHLEKEDRELLNWAALIHEIGLDISHTQFHKHGAYLVNHSDLLGFSKDYQQQLAALVRGHRRSFPLDLLAEFPPGLATRLKKLCMLLRLSIVLNHIRLDEVLPEYTVTAGPDWLKVSLGAGWLEQHPLTEADVEGEQKYFAKAGYQLIAE